MPRKKTQNKEEKQKRVSLRVSDDPSENLRNFIAEADQVEFLTKQLGWDVITRDFNNYKKQKSEEIPYLNKDSKEFNDAIIEYRAVDKFFRLIEDYRINRQKAIEELVKIDNPQTHINLDIDNT